MKSATLGDVAEWGSGGTPKRSVAEYFGEGLPWLSIADLNDGIVNEARESLTPEGIESCSAKPVPAGTIFVAMYGSIGKLGIAGREMCTSQAIAYAKPNLDLVDRDYLFHFLRAERPKLRARGRGGTQMNIGQADLKSWPILLPTLDKQRRIAGLLNQANAIRVRRRQVLDRIDALLQSTFQDMFGASAGLGQALLGEIADVTSGITKGRRTSDPVTPVPYLAVLNVQAGRLNMDVVKEIDATEAEIKRYALRGGDLVLTEGGDPDKLGRGTLWRKELPLCLHQNHIFRVRLNSTDVIPEYLESYMASRVARAYFLRAAKWTTGIASINMKQLRALPVAVPSIDQQKLFVKRINVIKSQRSIVGRAINADDELFASLQSRAFKGDL